MLDRLLRSYHQSFFESCVYQKFSPSVLLPYKMLWSLKTILFLLRTISLKNMNDLTKLVVTLVLLNILVGTGNDSNQRFKNKYSKYINRHHSPFFAKENIFSFKTLTFEEVGDVCYMGKACALLSYIYQVLWKLKSNKSWTFAVCWADWSIGKVACNSYFWG